MTGNPVADANPPAVVPAGGFLSRLLGGTDVERFLDDYWERRHLFIPSDNATKFSDVLSQDDIDSFLARNDVRYPSAMLVRDGDSIPLSAYTRRLRIGAYEAYDLVDMDLLLAEYGKGATCVIQLMQNSFTSIAHAAGELAATFRCRVDVHAFITPATGRGLSAHYDTASAFLVQLSGRKRWKLYETEIDVPLPAQNFDRARGVSGNVIDEVVMSPGDVLYLPRGVPHEGVALGESSTHLTVVIFPKTWIDLLTAALRVCEVDRSFREAPVAMTGASDQLDTLAPTWNDLIQRMQSAALSHGLILDVVPAASSTSNARHGRYSHVAR
jgi:lysine-specific demethylase/histidyl-hydroxylase NO66